jgi:hypothetical protein
VKLDLQLELGTPGQAVPLRLFTDLALVAK